MVKIGDLLSDTGKFLEGAKVSEANLSTMHYFKLISIVDATPNNWRLVIKHNSRHFPPQLLSDSITIVINEKEVDLSNVTSKLLYGEFKAGKQTPPTAQKKLKNKYPQLAVDKKKIYSLPFVVTIETKIREFQYKLLNDIVFTNEKLFRFKMIDSPFCPFCKKDVESLEHLLFHCTFVESFWKTFTSWLANQNITLETLTLVNILFGVYNENENIILNHLILMAKFCIYKCKLNSTNPSSKVFIAKTKTVYQIERQFATKHDKLLKHYEKWKKILPSIQ